MILYLNFSNPAGDSSYTKNFDNIFDFPNSWKEIIVCFYSTHEKLCTKIWNKLSSTLSQDCVRT